MFSACPVVDSVTAPPNTAVDPVSLGLPGTLPVINRRAMEMALRVGLALGCEIPPVNQFARKSYFYPDLPKGYQISQYDRPLAVNGLLDTDLADGTTAHIRIRRAHLEEDTGKSTHTSIGSLIDYNRAGVPLLELVTEPVITSAKQAADFARELQLLLRYLDVAEANVEPVSEDQCLAVSEVRSDVIRIQVTLVLIGGKNHDDVSPLGGLWSGHHLETGFSGLGS
jgi:aspartyl-tRNA(Asn)/glutamyl-tRNA(Gln) amidotransferase subunit B